PRRAAHCRTSAPFTSSKPRYAIRMVGPFRSRRTPAGVVSRFAGPSRGYSPAVRTTPHRGASFFPGNLHPTRTAQYPRRQSPTRGDGPMSAPGSVTCWLDGLRAGDAAAAQVLWEGYYSRLVGLAKQRLRGAAGGPADEEDVALSAFDSFCRGAARGRFPRLNDRDDLWQVLVLLTARKASDAIRAKR